MSVDKNLREIFGVDERPVAFDQVSITVASPEIIRSWSKGEVKNPETINYRTFKPEKGGLFCEQIFGPTRDWECACGKYKRIKHKGVVCDRCGVEVTLSRVRRERMGHIELAVPVSHIWFYKCMPSRIGLMLDMSARQLERVIYYEDYVVTDQGNTALEIGQLLSEVEIREAEDTYGDGSFKAMMGAEAIMELLKQIDLATLAVELEEELGTTKSKQNKKKLSKRLKITQGFAASKTRPEWMVQLVLPVIPPDLRPLVPLAGGRFATSDLNDLYRRVINRNNRVKNLLLLKTPEVIIRNEKRMLQEAVDALFDNGRHGRAVTGAGNRPLKSLSDMLKGKAGRFRQNLLGKRVDYSGRSVIVVGPDLKLGQCGLPKKMALTLFEPFIIRRLKELGYCHTVRSAKKIIDSKTTEVWDILAEVTKGHPILLNRAPTLHRLSIQAFEPKLIEGEAIRLHPLVCPAFNADFDGDQMAVHVPLSIEAQMECRQLMLAPNNIFSPASGRPITVPSQDIILGTYYLTWAGIRTQTDCEKQEHLPLFENSSEVEFAIASRKIDYHSWIRIRNPDFGNETPYGEEDLKVIETTPGRVRFNEIWPDEIGFYNKTVGKKQIGDIIWRCTQVSGKKETVVVLDKLKTLGFMEAMRSGISIGIVDMLIPEEKPEVIASAYAEVEKVSKQYRNGVITNGERYQKVVDIWIQATDTIANALYRKIEHNEGKGKASPLFMVVDSGARGNKSQIKQLGGMRGLMAKPSGEIIERPIISNFREGLSVLEYFISTQGARKGLSTAALKTADSGYMTRKLVDVAQDVIVFQQDCGTANGISVEAIYDGDEEVASLSTLIYGRVSCEKVKDPVSGKVIVKVDDVISESQANTLEKIGHEKLKTRSVLTCEAGRGCCANCYGLNLATGLPVKIGEAVGIIAAHSIGEPATQLTLNLKHLGGIAPALASKQPIIVARNSGSLFYKNLRTVQDADKRWVVLNKNGSVSIRDKGGLELESHNIIIGSVIKVKDGADAKKNDTIVEWDPYNVPILTEKAGKIEFRDMILGITVASAVDNKTGEKGAVVTEHNEDLHPQVCIADPKTGEVLISYSIPVGSHLSVKEGEKVSGGTQLAKTLRKVARTKDITVGLPRLAEIFEARKPKEACIISKIDGEVSFGSNVCGKKKVIITDPQTGEQFDHLVPIAKHIIVTDGDKVKRGDKVTEGSVSPEDLLEACGATELQGHLVNEVQSVYRVQGVEINDKHIEVIVRQMLRKVKITEPGDADQFLWGDQVERTTFKAVNAEIIANGGKPAEGEPVLLGITKASLETDSFISAASFQDPTRVLTEAATLGSIDHLTGFKENVIMGHLIPAGTGFHHHRDSEFEFTVEEPEPVDAGPEMLDDEEDVVSAKSPDRFAESGSPIARSGEMEGPDSIDSESVASESANDSIIGKMIGPCENFVDLMIVCGIGHHERTIRLRDEIVRLSHINADLAERLMDLAARENAGFVFDFPRYEKSGGKPIESREGSIPAGTREACESEDVTGLPLDPGEPADLRLLRESSASGHTVLPTHVGSCMESGKLATQYELEECTETGASVLPSLLGFCTVSSRRVLKRLLHPSAVSGELLLPSAGGRSARSGALAKINEMAVSCWDGKTYLPDETARCSLTGVLLCRDHLTSEGESSIIRDLLDGKGGDRRVPYCLLEFMRQTPPTELGNLKELRVVQSPSSPMLIFCGERRFFWGLKRMHVGGFFLTGSVGQMTGRIVSGIRKSGKWVQL